MSVEIQPSVAVHACDGQTVEVHAVEVHTVPFGDGWANQKKGDTRILSMHRTHAEAVFVGREIARREGGEHVIHGREGIIRDRQQYASASGAGA